MREAARPRVDPAALCAAGDYMACADAGRQGDVAAGERACALGSAEACEEAGRRE